MKKIILKQLIVTIAIALLFALNSGTAQTNNEKINSLAYNNVVNLVVEAFNDSSISIALCKVPVTHQYPALVFESEEKTKNFSRISTDLGSTQIQVIDKLRGNGDIDSLFFLNWTTSVTREGYKANLPFFSPSRGSEWILFLESPFRKSNRHQVYLMEKYEKLNVQAFLNANNFFTLYELNAGALCTYCPEDAKYPPQFIYLKELVDDFKTIIKLQENPSLLLESDDSYDTYYNSMKDDFGKRVFSRLFDNPNQE